MTNLTISDILEAQRKMKDMPPKTVAKIADPTTWEWVECTHREKAFERKLNEPDI